MYIYSSCTYAHVEHIYSSVYNGFMSSPFNYLNIPALSFLIQLNVQSDVQVLVQVMMWTLQLEPNKLDADVADSCTGGV